MSVSDYLNLIPLAIGIIIVVNNKWFAAQWLKINSKNTYNLSKEIIRKRTIIISIVVIFLSLYRLFSTKITL